MAKRSTDWRYPKPGESLAQYVRAARDGRSLTQGEMVQATGLSLAAIRKIEEGRTVNPGVFNLLRIWHALGMPLNAIDQLPAPPTVAAGRNALCAANQGDND